MTAAPAWRVIPFVLLSVLFCPRCIPGGSRSSTERSMRIKRRPGQTDWETSHHEAPGGEGTPSDRQEWRIETVKPAATHARFQVAPSAARFPFFHFNFRGQRNSATRTVSEDAIVYVLGSSFYYHDAGAAR